MNSRQRPGYLRRAWKNTKSVASRYGPAVARVAAYNAGRSFTRTMSTSENAGGALTGQRDAKTDYRKRRLSKRQRYRARRRWRRKRSVINMVRDANIGTTHIVRRSLCNLTTASGFSGYVGFGLNSLNGQTGEAYNTHDDIGEVFKEMAPAAWSEVLDPAGESPVYKLHQFHGTAEYTIRNNNTIKPIRI